MKTRKFILGAHSLSVLFQIDTSAKLQVLEKAMLDTVIRGGKLFEIPFLLVGGCVTWQDITTVAKNSGIEEIALCHFWPMKPDGKSVCGDPLGDGNDFRRALETIENIIAAVKIIRENGITVRFIDGPTWGGLGKDYINLHTEVVELQSCDFLQQAGDMCYKKDIVLAVEFLRPIEDKVIGGTEKMMEILEIVDHPAVMMHFDVFHAIECGEDPAEMIRWAGSYIAYLHLHGNGRLAPGSDGDRCDWKKIVGAINGIPSRIDDIPVVSEPFGEETCKENPALGQGLPAMPPLATYLGQAYKTLTEAGLHVAS